MWDITDGMLEKWKVPLNDRLDYKRAKREREELEDGKKSKLAAFLVSFFFGAIGVDWFYLSAGSGGYIVAGIFKILTCGGLGTGIIKLNVRYYLHISNFDNLYLLINQKSFL